MDGTLALTIKVKTLFPPVMNETYVSQSNCQRQQARMCERSHVRVVKVKTVDARRGLARGSRPARSRQRWLTVHAHARHSNILDSHRIDSHSPSDARRPRRGRVEMSSSQHATQPRRTDKSNVLLPGGSKHTAYNPDMRRRDTRHHRQEATAGSHT